MEVADETIGNWQIQSSKVDEIEDEVVKEDTDDEKEECQEKSEDHNDEEWWDEKLNVEIYKEKVEVEV